MADVKPCRQSCIDGAWVDGGAGRTEVTDPATGERIAVHALADAADVDSAVQPARRIHQSGGLTAMRPIERSRMAQAKRRYLPKHKDEIARVLTLEHGKPLWQAHIDRTVFGANMGAMASDGQRDTRLA